MESSRKKKKKITMASRYTTVREHKPRAELVRAAHAAAAALFVGKPSLSADLVRRAKSAAFEAVRRADPTAGLSTHPSAAYSYGIVAVADEGVKEAQDSWARIKRNGGIVKSKAQLDRRSPMRSHGDNMSQYVIANRKMINPLDLEPFGQRSTPIVTLSRGQPTSGRDHRLHAVAQERLISAATLISELMPMSTSPRDAAQNLALGRSATYV